MDRDEYTALLPILGAFDQYRRATEKCIEDKLWLPALVLIYSYIDSLAWLESTDDSIHGSVRFQAWADKWLLSRGNLNCSSIDLYGARSGLLHRMTSDSNLSEKGRARRIIYDYVGVDPSSLLKDHHISSGELVVVNLVTLANETNDAAVEFMGSCDHDSSVRARFITKAERFYSVYPNLGSLENVVPPG
jgi:hypothetical protein